MRQRVRCRITPRNQLRQCLRLQLPIRQRLIRIRILRINQKMQQILPITSHLLPLLHRRDRNLRQFLDTLQPLREKPIPKHIRRIRLNPRHSPDCSTPFAPLIQHSDPVIMVIACLNEMEGFAKREVPDDVKGEVIGPFQKVEFGDAGWGEEIVHLFEEEGDVFGDVRFEAADGLLREGVGDDFTFSGVVSAGTGVEEATMDGDEGIVEFGFGEAVAMSVYLLKINLHSILIIT